MDEYTFTGDQLDRLLEGTLYLYQEYISQHGYTWDRAKAAAILNTLNGLDAERELADHGELTGPMTQIYDPLLTAEGERVQGVIESKP